MAKRKDMRDELRRKRKQREARRAPLRARDDDLGAGLLDIFRAMADGPMAEFPGACDPSVARPDMVKYRMATLAEFEEPGRSKLKRLEQQYRLGKLGFLPEIEHWAMEEFFWHGAPGDEWHPLEAFLQGEGDHFPPAARRQLRRWKEAELRVLEIGEVRDSTVQLRPWNLREASPAGVWFRAIDLSMSGVKLYRPHAGSLTLTYLAPWAPEEDLFCTMGYGMILAKANFASLLVPQFLADPQLVCSRWPWEADARSKRESETEWRRRDWQGWFEQRVVFPFDAVVLTNEGPALLTVEDIERVSGEQARKIGIYFGVRCGGMKLRSGATGIYPLDMSARNAATFAEYRAYRDLVGPPPGVRRLQARR